MKSSALRACADFSCQGRQREWEPNHLRALNGKDLENLELRLRLELSEKLRQLSPPRSE